MDWELSRGMSDAQAEQFYHDISSCAESGWDFSSRWCAQVHPAGSNETDLRTIRTTTIVPVDLNAYLYQMERNVAAFAAELGQNDVAAEFASHAAKRKGAMQALMWNQTQGLWNHVVTGTRTPPTHRAVARPADAGFRPGHRDVPAS